MMTVRNAILDSLMYATALAVPLQAIIDPSEQNIACACVILVSSLTLLLYIKYSAAVYEQPLSVLALIGFSVTTQLGALLVQTGSWTPVQASLYTPLYTFSVLAFFQAVALGAHVVYRFFSSPDPQQMGIIRSVFRWAGVYRIPSIKTVWAMAGLGLVSFFLAAHVGILARIASPFNILTWTPFLAPVFAREVGAEYCNMHRMRVSVACYAGIVVLLGIALNVRVVMFIGLITIVLVYLVIGLRSQAPLTAKTLKRLCFVVLIAAAMAPTISNLATAMAIARGARGHVSAVGMIERTVSILQRPALIAEYRASNSNIMRYAAYDEHYIKNPLMARFVETKFHDNALHFASALTTPYAKQQLTSVTIDSMLSAAPAPLLRALGISVDKDALYFSGGDYLAYLSRGIPLGGFKTGSMFAQGLAIMGAVFPIVYALACLILFGLMDLLTIRMAGGAGKLSALAMITTWSIFFRGVTSDLVSNVFIYIVRNYWQTVLIYVIVFVLARVFLGERAASVEPAADSGWRPAA